MEYEDEGFKNDALIHFKAEGAEGYREEAEKNMSQANANRSNNNNNEVINGIKAVFPTVFLSNYGDGGHIVRGKVIPKIRRGVAPSRFLLVPLKQHQSSMMIDFSHVALSRTAKEYMKSLEGLSGKLVAIMDEEGRFISCRRLSKLNENMALAEYRSNLGVFESFVLTHHNAYGTYSFRSHNNLHLHFHPRFRRIQFGNIKAVDATWSICPLGLKYSISEHILFIGMVHVSIDDDGERDSKYLLERTAEGEQFDKSDIKDMLKMIPFDRDDSEQCSMFSQKKTGLKWFVLRKMLRKCVDLSVPSCGGWTVHQVQMPCTPTSLQASVDVRTPNDLSSESIYIILISSPNFPVYLAADCLVDCELLLEKYADEEQDRIIRKHAQDKSIVMGKRLSSLMDFYDELYANSLYRRELDGVVKQMNENFRKLTENVVQGEDLLKKAEELNEQCEEFFRNSRKLKNKLLYDEKSIHPISAMIAVGACTVTGATIGWLAGGPTTAFFFASQAMDIASLATVGLLGGLASVSAHGAYRNYKFKRVSSHHTG